MDWNKLEGLPGEDITTEDCIMVFPANTGMKSVYVVFARPIGEDHSYHPAPKELAAFPDAVRVGGNTRVKGGGSTRKRWKDAKGRIFEWDSQHGAVEIYDRQGKHLGEFDAVTGTQNKPPKPDRRIEK